MSFLLSRPPHLLSAAPLSDDAYGADVRQGPSGTGDLGESVVVRPVLTKGEAKKARILLSQNIEELSDMRVPDFVGQDDGSLRPTLIVAFFEDRMVGAALVGPIGNYAVAFEQNIRAFHPWCDARKASEILRKSVAEVQGLVVDSLHQGKGIGLRRIPDGRVLVTLKLFVISRSHLSVVGL